METKEKTEFEKWNDHFKNLPIECRFCYKQHSKESIQYISVYEGRREPVCNIECAIKFAEREIVKYDVMIKQLRTRLKELRITK